MGFLLRLVVAYLLTVETCKVKALYMPSMAVEPVFPVGNPSKPHTTLEELSYAPWLPMSPLALPQQKSGIDEHQFPNEPKFQVKPPQFPGKPLCSIGSPAGSCRPPVYSEPKYPIGGLVPQVVPPQFPGRPPCSTGSPAGSCRPPMFPFGPKYPIQGPVGHGLEHLLLVNLEPPKTHEDLFYHGYPPKSLGCWSKWPFLPSRPC
ncbi:hypothetical protein GOODEAATRI_023903 [Goodea atripinnis]|uniref:Beta-casein n=1 Tax=Goodea atripinnis TaxID=208336 RepID=A0ABV0PGL2_9TELE